jgi:hypothetical protein
LGNEGQDGYVLVVDSEGVMSPEKSDSEFDRRICSYLVMISDRIIVNIKGEMDLPLKNLLTTIGLCISQLNPASLSLTSLHYIFS